MSLDDIKEALLEVFTWQGDANMSERNHLLVPVKVPHSLCEPQSMVADKHSYQSSANKMG